MPGPEALRKQEYYGFNGNHFWTIVTALLGEKKPASYEGKIDLVRRNRIALWDVLESCVRKGASDSAIRNEKCNPIADLLRSYPKIEAVFINGRAAHKLFLRRFEGKVKVPVMCLPSTSPAYAAMSIKSKIEHWKRILKHNRPAEVNSQKMVTTKQESSRIAS
jgi:hypoxanthine-DNA glycosylase